MQLLQLPLHHTNLSQAARRAGMAHQRERVSREFRSACPRWKQEALGLGDAPPMEAPALAAEALADGRDRHDAELALEVFAAAGPSFTESYRCKTQL